MIDLLLVEDDAALGASLSRELGNHGYRVHWAKSVREALEAIASVKIGGALVDIGLPDGDGFQVARALKKQPALPMLFLSARNEAEDRLQGFELGADDYIPKPFHLRELLLRLERCLGTVSNAKQIKLDACTIDFERQTILYNDGRRIFPKTSDFEVLAKLIEAAPRVLSREELDAAVFAKDRITVPRSVDNAIMRLRGLLGPQDEKCLRTVRGTGYQWCK